MAPTTKGALYANLCNTPGFCSTLNDRSILPGGKAWSMCPPRDTTPTKQVGLARHSIRAQQVSEPFSAEEVDQLYDQNDDYGQFEEKSAALIELIHHEPVKVLCNMNLRSDDIPII